MLPEHKVAGAGRLEVIIAVFRDPACRVGPIILDLPLT